MGWTLYDRQPEEEMFTSVPEGWVLTIGPKRSYLVNDAQKAELLARLASWRFLLPLLLVPVFAALPYWVGFATFVPLAISTAFLVVRFVMPSIRLFILGSILAGAGPVNAAPRPAPADIRDVFCAPFRQQAQICSTRFLILGCLVFGAASVRAVYLTLVSHGDYIHAILTILMAVDFGVILMLKLGERRVWE